MTIDKTIKSKYQPKQTNVTWVDLSGLTPVEKHFINGRWRPIGGGGSTNPGYSTTKQTVTLFDDTIETVPSRGIYQWDVEPIDFDIIVGENYTVVFDSISYDIKAISGPDNSEILGEFNNNPSFETHPFCIMFSIVEGVKGFTVYTNTGGSHTVVIKHEEGTVTTTPEFKDAVDSVTGYSIDKGNETLYDGTVEISPDGNSFSGVITPPFTPVEGDTYKVTFNGTEYICKCFNDGGYLTIGAQFTGETYDWSTYPFNIEKDSLNEDAETIFNTNQEGSCTLKIEHITASTKTTPAFESMIQGIVVGSGSNSDIIVYPDSVLFMDGLYSIYNNPPEQGKIYFIPFMNNGSPDGEYLYPVHIDELTNNDNNFSGYATIIGTPIILNNGTLTVLDFGGVINPDIFASGLQIVYSIIDNTYRLSYKAGASPLS